MKTFYKMRENAISMGFVSTYNWYFGPQELW